MDWNDTDHIDPGGRWIGWRLRGNFLISPDGDKITPERLRGILFREDLAKRTARWKAVNSGLAEGNGDASLGLAEKVRALRPGRTT